MKVIFVLLVIFIILIALMLFDMLLGRAAYKKQAYEPVFDPKKSNITLIHCGSELVRQMTADIRQAVSSIHMMFFIMKNDQVSHEMFDLLKEKARAGVSVYLLLDWAGSRQVKKPSIQTMKKAGVHVHFLNKPAFPFLFFRLQKRNHRKVTVIDGKIGYVGGFNIAEEYLGKKAKFGNWEDYHLRMTGEGTADLQTLFVSDLKRNTGKTPESPGVYPALSEGNISHRTYASDGFSLESHYENCIRKAEKKIIIGTPYYVPSKKLQEALISACRKGVKVILIVPMKSDHPLVRETAFAYYPELLKAGCLIYRYYQGFYHVKAFIIDDRISIIGTPNFDKRSLFWNEEVNVIIHDEAFTKEVLSTIKQDIEKSELLTLEKVKQRSVRQLPAEWLGKAISYFL
ncbi:cardiolipin synthase [Bacillus velezensis]|uniref:cardiolipin synthase n=1 Tax=Bacillus velezensis TaxID=492670 RepID=UPI00100BD8C7|nr:cardiolipin synthase [Bacillus velezensis]MEC3795890.1 cardiolipin synthase [Bacillus velezensis]RXK30364.1 cardiolipin synthase [Bacillus velezensis]